jgi:hypothetical protein
VFHSKYIIMLAFQIFPKHFTTSGVQTVDQKLLFSNELLSSAFQNSHRVINRVIEKGQKITLFSLFFFRFKVNPAKRASGLISFSSIFDTKLATE